MIDRIDGTTEEISRYFFTVSKSREILTGREHSRQLNSIVINCSLLGDTLEISTLSCDGRSKKNPLDDLSWRTEIFVQRRKTKAHVQSGISLFNDYLLKIRSIVIYDLRPIPAYKSSESPLFEITDTQVITIYHLLTPVSQLVAWY